MSKVCLIILYFIGGFAGGIFGGMGMGGGTILIPILTIFFSLEQRLCQGINLISFLVMSLIVLIIHFKNGYLSLSGTLYIITSGIIFAFGGAILAGWLPSRILRRSFGVFLCLLALYQGYKTIFAQRLRKNRKKTIKKGKSE